jgi:hypothetical protein
MAHAQRRRITRLDRAAHTIRDINTIAREIVRLAPYAIAAAGVLAVGVYLGLQRLGVV